MNILVYDVAAESGGAAVVLERFYNKHKADKNNHYYYLLSTYELEETDNITVIHVPEIKKNWGKRLLFDLFGVKRYIRNYKIDEVLSLQNIGVFGFHGNQTVYEHNALPFCEYRYGFFESTIMWVYQNIIGRLVIESVKMADLVIVQTDWMKEAVADKARINKSKIVVDFPSDIIPDGYRYKEAKNCFFYPANSTPFKNHRLILEAAKILNAQGIYNFEVIFTLSGNETEDIKSIAQTAMKEKINFRWIGAISREKVFELYEKSVLLFPSYIETVGLPVYEAKSLGCPILVSDCAYARNIVNNYNKAEFFFME